MRYVKVEVREQHPDGKKGDPNEQFEILVQDARPDNTWSNTSVQNVDVDGAPIEVLLKGTQQLVIRAVVQEMVYDAAQAASINPAVQENERGFADAADKHAAQSETVKIAEDRQKALDEQDKKASGVASSTNRDLNKKDDTSRSIGVKDSDNAAARAPVGSGSTGGATPSPAHPTNAPATPQKAPQSTSTARSGASSSKDFK